jgi:hypothetical protein
MDVKPLLPEPGGLFPAEGVGHRQGGFIAGPGVFVASFGRLTPPRRAGKFFELDRDQWRWLPSVPIFASTWISDPHSAGRRKGRSCRISGQHSARFHGVATRRLRGAGLFCCWSLPWRLPAFSMLSRAVTPPLRRPIRRKLYRTALTLVTSPAARNIAASHTARPAARRAVARFAGRCQGPPSWSCQRQNQPA